MPKEDRIVSSKVKHKGMFDLDLLYSKLRGWMVGEGYSDPVQDGEHKYSEKIKPDGKSIEIVWTASKDAEEGYFKITINVSFYVNGLKKINVERDGKQIELDKAEVEIGFDSSVTRNAGDKPWNEDGLFFKIYERWIIKDKIEEYKIECYKDTNDLMAEAKNFLNLYTF